jgi:hypothetical protein
VLFHVTADPRWSDLPISGAFVDMLKVIVDTAGTVAQQQAPANADSAEPAASPWKPLEVLDGFGDLEAPEPGATLVSTIENASPSAATPPGIYDRDGVAFALNTIRAGNCSDAVGPRGDRLAGLAAPRWRAAGRSRSGPGCSPLRPSWQCSTGLRCFC